MTLLPFYVLLEVEVSYEAIVCKFQIFAYTHDVSRAKKINSNTQQTFSWNQTTL